VLAVASLPGNAFKLKPIGGAVGSALNAVWCGLLFWISVAYLVDATFNPFLYFRF